MIPVFVRMTMNVLLVLKTAQAGITLYRQNRQEIRRAVRALKPGKVRLSTKEANYKRYEVTNDSGI